MKTNPLALSRNRLQTDPIGLRQVNPNSWEEPTTREFPSRPGHLMGSVSDLWYFSSTSPGRSARSERASLWPSAREAVVSLDRSAARGQAQPGRVLPQFTGDRPGNISPLRSVIPGTCDIFRFSSGNGRLDRFGWPIGSVSDLIYFSTTSPERRRAFYRGPTGNFSPLRSVIPLTWNVFSGREPLTWPIGSVSDLWCFSTVSPGTGRA